jgi:hypothetical protein
VINIPIGTLPAFPVECQFGPGEKVRGMQTGTYSGYEIGLTKRELFAAMAMQGMLTTDEAWDRSEEKIATYAVDQADALLAELSKAEAPHE